jgi:hypothetical protein
MPEDNTNWIMYVDEESTTSSTSMTHIFVEDKRSGSPLVLFWIWFVADKLAKWCAARIKWNFTGHTEPIDGNIFHDNQ